MLVNLNIKNPTNSLVTSQVFKKMIEHCNRFEREEVIQGLILEGQVPSWQRQFVDVTITKIIDKQEKILTLKVLPDYLTIGTDDEFVRIPMFPITAQKIADEWDCLLPTTKIVNSVWHQSLAKVAPQPWGPPYDASMMNNDRIFVHNDRIEKSFAKINATKQSLKAGHKKDVVITNELIKKQKRVAIYGWHNLDGSNIQPLYLGHEATYADYSHGIRLISRECILNESCCDLESIMKSESLHKLVSDENKLEITQYSL